uniref:Uncharacterized protein n=1 Tax=Oryza brachyantha TaxID=4533 RepID=J3LL84_ORYBR
MSSLIGLTTFKNTGSGRSRRDKKKNTGCLSTEKLEQLVLFRIPNLQDTTH